MSIGLQKKNVRAINNFLCSEGFEIRQTRELIKYEYNCILVVRITNKLNIFTFVEPANATIEEIAEAHKYLEEIERRIQND